MIADNTPWEMPELPGDVSVLELAYYASFSIYTDPPRHWAVRIGGTVVLHPSSGEPLEIDTEGPPERLAPLLRLIRSTLTSATSDRFGTLELTFGTGDRIVAPADPNYESWQINGPQRLLIVCTPGGELVIWGPDPPG